MAKVDNPKYDELGEVSCGECPLVGLDVCNIWMVNHSEACPKADTYQEACVFAESCKTH